MMLEVYILGDELNWQRSGHFGNVHFGVSYCPTLKLLPFKIQTGKALTVTTFEARKVKPLERSIGVQLLKTVDLVTSTLSKVSETLVDSWYYAPSTDILGVNQGYWQFYVKFSNDAEYITELMYVPCADEIIECLPDFNNDFNNDFLICDE